MSAFAVGLMTFTCVFGGALFGLALRAMLPEEHLSDISKDVLKMVTGLVATLSALVLGLLIASAKSSFDSVNNGLKQVAVKVILIDRALAEYGPAAQDLRATLRDAYAARVDELFPPDGGGARISGTGVLHGDAVMEQVDAKLRALAPADDRQRALKARAEQRIEELAQARWLGFEQAQGTTPAGFLVVLVSWLAAMFAAFGLLAPRNATAVAALAIGALAVSTAIFLIEEMGSPLGGIIAPSDAPLRDALRVLGK